jgi:hypothetical protein
LQIVQSLLYERRREAMFVTQFKESLREDGR